MSCNIITYKDRNYYVDCDDAVKIINFKKNFIYDDKYDYPSFNSNYKKYFLIEFLYDFDMDNVDYVFSNNNKYDLRKCNVIPYHKFHNEIEKKHKIIKYIPGHINELGNSANQMKTPYGL
jgi:hypothetical protein